MFTPIGFYSTQGGTSTSAYYSADVYKLRYYNTTVTPYSKNNGAEVGAFYRASGVLYVSELLAKNTQMITDMSGKTVEDVQIEYTVTASNGIAVGTSSPIRVSQCDVSWTDTQSTQPDYDTPFDVNRAWPTTLVTDSITTWQNLGTPTPTGTYLISKSQAQIDLVQGWVNGTTTNNGIILGMNFNYYASVIQISTVRFWVKYK